MLRELLGVGQQVIGQRLILGTIGAALAGAGDGANSHRAVAQTYENLRARSDHREAAKIEKEEKGRGVETA